MKRNRLLMGLLLLAGSAGLAGCGQGRDAATGAAGTEGKAMATIEGSVIYRERIALRPGSEVEVQLQDISKADAPATVLTTVRLTPTGGPPFPFTIDYDPSRIDERMRYALRATISRQGKLLFSSTDYIDPFAGNPLEILVRQVPEPVATVNPSLEGTSWELQTLGGEAAGTGAGGKPLAITFLAEEMRVGGFSGCNRYTGGYTRDGASEHGAPLQFGPLAGTMMACQEGGELERQYLKALAGVTAFRFNGADLELLAGPEVVATYRARD